VKEICIDAKSKGKYKTLEECVFSDECLKKLKIDNSNTISLVKEKYRTNISDEDILYSDVDVCILKPDVKKGVIVYSVFDNVNACVKGLKTGEQLHKEGIHFNRSVHHPYVFFRAPFQSEGIDYSTPEKEIYSSYGIIPFEKTAFIRVDPSRTFVYSSEIRTHIYHKEPNYDNIVRLSRKTLLDYLEIIKNNKQILKEKEEHQIPSYNLFTSKVNFYPPNFPNNPQPIERYSEILVRLNHLPSEYFVLCKN
jgi:hypothetical protein